MKSEKSLNLMIIVAPTEVRDKLSRQIDLAGLGVQWCDNIYKAVATIFSLLNNKSSEVEPMTVLAWVDNLSHSQLKFFSMLAQNGNIVPIAFSDFSQEKLDYAVELGALRGMLTDDIPTTLLKYRRTKNEDIIARVAHKREFSDYDIKPQPQSEQPVTKANWSEQDVSLSSEELDSLLLDEQEEMGY